jgi:hypothetical protein
VNDPDGAPGAGVPVRATTGFAPVCAGVGAELDGPLLPVLELDPEELAEPGVVLLAALACEVLDPELACVELDPDEQPCTANRPRTAAVPMTAVSFERIYLEIPPIARPTLNVISGSRGLPGVCGDIP